MIDKFAIKLNHDINGQPKTNQKWMLCSFKEQYSYFRQPDQHNNHKILAQLEKQKPNQP
jgi:hypothetical protein